MPNKKQRLEQTIAGLQGRFGARAIGRLTSAPPPALPTGFAALDDALAIGGLPCGRLTELIGVPTGGMVTLALRALARGQRTGSSAVYLDLYHSLDPDYAARCGVDLTRLTVVRPRDPAEGLAVLEDLVHAGDTGILVVDMPLETLLARAVASHVSQHLSRLLAPLDRAGILLLWLTALPPNSRPTMADYPAISLLPHFAAVRLFIRREGWLYHRDDIRGYQAEVRVVKNKFAPAGRRASLELAFVVSDNP